MWKVRVFTLYPEIFPGPLNKGLYGKALEKKIWDLQIINIRDSANDKHKTVDDTPYGGGDGMVLMAEPLMKAIDYSFELLSSEIEDTRVVYPSPQGKKWDQNEAQKCISVKNFIFICGRYKGIDQRVVDKYVTHEYSIGDYVISNGELSSMVLIDSIIRLNPGTLNNLQSAKTDSFSTELLDHPHYTRPRVVDGLSVPEVLIGGHHDNIRSWRKDKSLMITREKRPDLWKKYNKKIKEMEYNHE